MHTWCVVPFLQARVSAATAEHRAARGPDNVMTKMSLRYFDSPMGAAAKQSAADPVPGVISKQLAEALGEWHLIERMGVALWAAAAQRRWRKL